MPDRECSPGWRTDRRGMLAASAAVLALVAARRGAAGPSMQQGVFDNFMGEFADDVLRQSPEQATFFGLDTGTRAELRRKLNDRSRESRARDGELWKSVLRRLSSIDRRSLSAGSRINYDVLQYAAGFGADGAAFPFGVNTLDAAVTESAAPYVISQQGGAYSKIPDFLDSQHPVRTRSDAEDYLVRLEAFAAALDDETGRIGDEAAEGVILPSFLLETTLAQVESLTKPDPIESGMVSSLIRRARTAGLSASELERLSSLATRAVGGLVYPALRRQAAQLASLRGRATSDAGVWKLPQGEAYYAWTLRVATTTSLTPGEIHRLGDEKTREISARMDALLKAQGLTKGSVGERMQALASDPKFLFPNNEAGKAQALAYLNELVARARARSAAFFKIQVRAPVNVKRVPPEIEAGAALGYEQHGSIDGSRPAAYYLNLRDTALWPKWSLPTITHHETIPGHVLQGAFVVERHRLPLARIVIDFNAYAEGWALYAEQMADEIGLYEDDPFGRLGYLQEQLLRAGRLVVDTGLHDKRWTRQQSIDWMRANVGQPLAYSTSEVDRYISLPGQACGYMIGLNEINRIRSERRKALGNRFDIRDFNDSLLIFGSVPLSLLAKVIESGSAE